MKVVVISDSHGNIERIKHVLGFGKEIGAGAVIHCGDWDNIQTVETVASSGIFMYGVLGNADIHPQMIDTLRKTCAKSDEDFLELELDGKKIAVCHFPDRIKDKGDGKHDIIFCGHTHKKNNLLVGKTRIVNPGALARTLEPTFAIYDTEQNNIEFINIRV